MSTRKWSEDDKSYIYERSKDSTNKDIAKEYGCSEDAIRHVIRSYRKAQGGLAPLGHTVKKTSTKYGPNGEVLQKWVQTAPEKEKAVEDFWAACELNAKNYKGIALPSKAKGSFNKDLLTVYPLGDPHIGLFSWHKETGEDFDLNIAKREIVECLKQLVASSPPSEKCTIINLGDLLHAQDDTQLTPSGKNKQDVDSRFGKVSDVAHEIFRAIIDLALQKHKYVTVANIPGNHDPRIAYEIAAWLKAVYERQPRVTIAPAYSPFYYERHGKVLIGSTHGDGAIKSKDLPGIMAEDCRKDWGQCEYCYWHCGHVHHTDIKEYTGCIVEYHNTLAAKDFWTTKQGYRSRRMLKSITYHKNFGEESRNTVSIERVKASLGK